jgi:hypothetical protein
MSALLVGYDHVAAVRAKVMLVEEEMQLRLR